MTSRFDSLGKQLNIEKCHNSNVTISTITCLNQVKLSGKVKCFPLGICCEANTDISTVKITVQSDFPTRQVHQHKCNVSIKKNEMKQNKPKNNLTVN